MSEAKHSERELLKAAATAAGDSVWLYRDIYLCWSGEPHSSLDKLWNPLTDYSDAMRLAMKLGFVIDFSTPSHPEVRYWLPGEEMPRRMGGEVKFAIVGAAAAIARATGE